ncbi:timeless-interacting protein [Quercus suber]|uniref:Timeless-interacting protein n=1 Tax=Quercus suber TaxID=58331 RepID=A0AAW0KK46_QUESU
MENAAAAPTGCYKCGRPGHWSRDCPSSASASASASPLSLIRNPQDLLPLSRPQAPAPKLTPDLILSDDGLGYVLRHFPRSFKFRGHGHEVSDLGNLIGLYSEWHSRLLPYYSFDQFVHKAEQVAATKRVKLFCG